MSLACYGYLRMHGARFVLSSVVRSPECAGVTKIPKGNFVANKRGHMSASNLGADAVSRP